MSETFTIYKRFHFSVTFTIFHHDTFVSHGHRFRFIKACIIHEIIFWFCHMLRGPRVCYPYTISRHWCQLHLKKQCRTIGIRLHGCRFYIGALISRISKLFTPIKFYCTHVLFWLQITAVVHFWFYYQQEQMHCYLQWWCHLFLASGFQPLSVVQVDIQLYSTPFFSRNRFPSRAKLKVLIWYFYASTKYSHNQQSTWEFTFINIPWFFIQLHPEFL